MYRSRVTLANMEAKPIAGSVASPFMMVCWFRNSEGALSAPSKSTWQSFGSNCSLSNPCFIARLIAKTIPLLSIIKWLDETTWKFNIPSFLSWVASLKICSRFTGLIFFESPTPGNRLQSKLVGKETTPTVTGPASGPRPASSIPIKYFAIFLFWSLFVK